MERIVLACDESGAKGYSDRGESEDGEVGVFAGIMVPQSTIAQVEADFAAIQEKYRPASAKLHIADLVPTQQEALRSEIYATVRKHQLPCFWYAVHVEGFHRRHRDWQDQRAKSRVEAASLPNASRFKGGSPREDHASLHVFLFEGLYGHLVAFLEERKRQNVEIEVRTDRVDNPIVKEFEDIARELLGNLVSEEIVRRFDTLTRQVVDGKVRIEAHIPSSLEIGVRVKSLTIAAVDNDDGIVLAADVLANHLHKLFRDRDASEKYGPLNQPSAIRKHPLADHLDAFLRWGVGDPGDGLFRHPNRPK